MKIHQDNTDGSYRIIRHSSEGVQINDQLYARSVVVTPDQLISPWAPSSLIEMTLEHLKIAHTLDPEVLLLGTGAQQQFPAREIMRPILQSGVGLEVMDTGSACRTYNILMGEGRRVVAALIISA